jgi:hypothetical protein
MPMDQREEGEFGAARRLRDALDRALVVPQAPYYRARWEPQWKYPDGFIHRDRHLVLSSAEEKPEDLCLVQISYVALPKDERSAQKLLCSIGLVQGVEGARTKLFKEMHGVHPHELAMQHVVGAAAPSICSGTVRVGLHMDQVCRHKPLRDRFLGGPLQPLHGYNLDRFQTDWQTIMEIAYTKKRIQELLQQAQRQD